MKKEATILGAGIAGLTTAIALNQMGIETLIYEAAPNIKVIGAGLGLGANAIMAFDRLGIKDEVIARGRIIPSFSILDQNGRIITRTNSERISAKYGVDNFTIHRAELHHLLLSKINPQSICINKKAINIEREGDRSKIYFQDGTIHETDFLIVADGIHSVIRKKLVPDSEPRYAGYTCWRAVIDNTNLNLNETSETWGAGKRFGIVPLANNKIYWFACTNALKGDDRFKRFKISDLQNHFKDFHEPIPSILSETKNEDLIWGDIMDLKPLDKFAFQNVLLIGDAGHATTPNLGQGACQAIEDGVVLAQELKKETNIAIAFKNFERRRMRRVHYITNTSARVGQVAQWEKSYAVVFRNFLFRRIPTSVNERQLAVLYDVDF
jgi:2-polyprenyl-6-methoxyphenol hydroxylase-like FAD-dependent oxidoreductase